jgi:hypothetical protein
MATISAPFLLPDGDLRDNIADIPLRDADLVSLFSAPRGIEFVIRGTKEFFMSNFNGVEELICSTFAGAGDGIEYPSIEASVPQIVWGSVSCAAADTVTILVISGPKDDIGSATTITQTKVFANGCASATPDPPALFSFYVNATPNYFNILVMSPLSGAGEIDYQLIRPIYMDNITAPYTHSYSSTPLVEVKRALKEKERATWAKGGKLPTLHKLIKIQTTPDAKAALKEYISRMAEGRKKILSDDAEQDDQSQSLNQDWDGVSRIDVPQITVVGKAHGVYYYGKGNTKEEAEAELQKNMELNVDAGSKMCTQCGFSANLGFRTCCQACPKNHTQQCLERNYSPS